MNGRELPVLLYILVTPAGEHIWVGSARVGGIAN